MKLYLSVILALSCRTNAEEESTLKTKRGINQHYHFPNYVTLNDLHLLDYFNHDGNWLDTGLSSFLPFQFSPSFGENIFVPGYTLAHNFHQVIPKVSPVSVPQAITPGPPVHVPVAASPPATSYGVPQLPSQPAPTQVGRLGSGSLGYVYLGNGLYALGSGSLGYTPPAPPAQPPPQVPAPIAFGPSHSNQNGNYL